MDYKNPDVINNWIQTLSLLIAIIIFTFQIRQQRKDETNRDRRSDIKLKIYFFCQDEVRTYEEIANYLNIDAEEMDTSIYEMLREEMLRYRNGKVFKSRQYGPKKNEDE